MTLYLGLRPKENTIHFPLIKIVPRPIDLEDFPLYTHIVFTSQTSVEILSEYDFKGKVVFVVGSETKKKAEEFGCKVMGTPDEETAEGLIKCLDRYDLSGAYIFWPHSSLSRPVLTDYFEKRRLRFHSFVLYDTLPHLPGPLPSEFEEVIFTSPSTVHAFIHLFGMLPKNKKLTPIGSVTRKALNQSLQICYGEK